MKMTKKQRSPETAILQLSGKIPVEFLLDTPKSHSVAVAGNFNNWNIHETPLRKAERGIWRAIIPLPPGQYEYRFVVDGQWYNDPKAKDSRSNPFGSENSVRVVERPLTIVLTPTQAASQSPVPLQRQLQVQKENGR